MPITIQHGDAGILAALAVRLGRAQGRRAGEQEDQRRREAAIARFKSGGGGGGTGSFVSGGGGFQAGDAIRQGQERELRDAQIAALDAPIAQAHGASFVDEDRFRTRQEIATGQMTVEGERIRQARNLSDNEREQAIQTQSQQERVDPNQFMTLEQKQQAFEDSFDESSIVRDGLVWTQDSKGAWKSVQLPQAQGFSDSEILRAGRDVAKEHAELTSTEINPIPLSQAEINQGAKEKLLRDRALIESVRGVGEEVFQPGTGGVQFADPLAEQESTIAEFERRRTQRTGVQFVNEGTPTDDFLDPAQAPAESIFNARNAPGAKAQPQETSAVEISPERLELIQTNLSQSERNVLEAAIQTAETDEELQAIIREAAEQAFFNSLENSDDPAKKALAKELRKRNSPLLEALVAFTGGDLTTGTI